MEDEHICIDNLIEHLGTTIVFPAPGAFYGVSLILSAHCLLACQCISTVFGVDVNLFVVFGQILRAELLKNPTGI